MADHLIEPHGGTLIDLVVASSRADELREASRDWPSLDLNDRQTCDVELLINGSFSPLTGFLTRGDYDRVVSDMRLTDGTLWPMPITLDVTEEMAEGLTPGSHLALRDAEGVMLAVLNVEDAWTPDRETEAKMVFGTTDPAHPGVNYLLNRTKPVYVGGRVEALQPPLHYDFRTLRMTPKELRARFSKRGWRRIVAFQTRNPMHRAHLEITVRAAKEVAANLLIHPVTGMTKAGDVDHYTPGPGLPGHPRPLSPQHGRTVATSVGDADSWATRGRLARNHPQEPRLHALHRRSRPCGARLRRHRNPLLRAV